MALDWIAQIVRTADFNRPRFKSHPHQVKQLAWTRGDVYETTAYHHWCLVTVIVEEDPINTPVSSPRAFIRQCKIKPI